LSLEALVRWMRGIPSGIGAVEVQRRLDDAGLP
jgi:hypothetical protein